MKISLPARVIAALLLIGSLPATFAQTPAPSTDPNYLFRRLDTNNDGKISRDEFAGITTILADVAKGAERNGINVTTARGSASAGSASQLGDPTALFHKLDTNNDGSLSKEELAKIAGLLAITHTARGNPEPAEKGTNLPGAGSGGSSSGARDSGTSR